MSYTIETAKAEVTMYIYIYIYDIIIPLHVASLQHRVSSVMFSDHQLKTLTEGLFKIFCSKNDQVRRN